MNKFGQLKTSIEKTSIDLFGKNRFNQFMKEFKSNILENRDLSEIFFIYDDLSSKKGMDKDIATDYVNESIEYCQILIDNNKTKISKLSEWVSSYNSNTENNYKNIDTIIYNNSIKNLETVLESKKQIISNLISEGVKKEIKESVNLPLSVPPTTEEGLIRTKPKPPFAKSRALVIYFSLNLVAVNLNSSTNSSTIGS